MKQWSGTGPELAKAACGGALFRCELGPALLCYAEVAATRQELFEENLRMRQTSLRQDRDETAVQ